MGHDASAALIRDGQLAAAIEEERFHRYQKHYGGFPINSMRFCMETAGIKPADVDHFCYYISPGSLLDPVGLKYAMNPLFSIGPKIMLASRALYYLHCKTMEGRLKKAFPGLDPAGKIRFVRHHDAHMASSFFSSPFEEADILSIDGIGEWESNVLGYGVGNRIFRTKSIYFPNSLGYLFSAITRHLGFRVNNDEYKVMGLASYGDPERYMPLMRRVIHLLDDGSYEADASYFNITRKWGGVSAKFVRELGFGERPYGSEIAAEHKDLSAAVQAITEETGVHMARALQKKSGRKNVCLSGGVALNCVMNARILEMTDYEDIFIQPAAYDAAGSIGSALWVQHMELGKPRSFKMRHAYYGYEAGENEILSSLSKFGEVKYKKSGDIARDTAAQIAKGKIVGWCQGKMEWGPRALGARSLLADPRPRAMMDIMNDRVKHREDFRPFAPSCKAERYREYFDFPTPSPFMLLICGVVEDKKTKIAAVTHVDGTARYHTVERDANPLYWRVLDEFEKLTGVPVVLNTSFNVQGETIVMTPEDAIRCFLGTGIDVLAVGDYMVTKDGSEPPASSESGN